MRLDPRDRAFVLLGAIFVLATIVGLHAVTSRLETYRAEIGASDDAFLTGNDASWGRAYRDSGPFRVRRGKRRMTYFAARMAFPGAGIRLPVWIDGADAELSLRAHRYGQPGIIHVFGNGVRLDALVFETDTYPWEVFRLRVPEEILAKRELLLELRLEETAAAVDLPPEALVAFDWVELRPFAEDGSGSIRLAPHLPWLAVSIVGLALFTTWWGGFPVIVAGIVGALTSGLAMLSLGNAPGPTSGAFEQLPVVFAIGVLGYLGLRLVLGKEEHDLARRLSAAFTLTLLAHGTIIFFPDHQPPDLGPHIGLIRRLNDSRLTLGHFWEYSSSFGEDGRGKPHFGADYEAPYPPWTYMTVHALRSLFDHPRFWLEMVGMVCGGVMALFAYFFARRWTPDALAPPLAFLLVTLETSTWHHASRVHTPGMVGNVFFLVAIAYLLYRYGRLGRPGAFWTFALASFGATLAYTATLFHFVFFMVCFTATELVRERRLWPSPLTSRAVLAGVVGTLGAFALFYWHFVGPAFERSGAILDTAAYRPPATFLFLRNQMRDTVRILEGGYFAFVLVALPALVTVRAWARDELAKRVVIGWSATYVLLLVLKDPALFPQLFLHVKEDLLFATLMCVLGAVSLSWLVRRGVAGKLAVVTILIVLAIFQARDYLENADTIAVWAATQS
jgi:hypothetical protein